MDRDLAILEKLEKELNLKQLQIKSLLAITQAINDNVSVEGLFNMYKSFLSWEMGVRKMALFIKKSDSWHCASAIDWDAEQKDDLIDVVLDIHRMHTVKEEDPELLQEFDIIIPVRHKEMPLSYALIGGLKETEDIYNKIQFITTITNIIAVAIENKRLFKEQINQEGLRREMKLASEVQKMLIPDALPKEERFELSSIYQPHFNVGGDYFDYIKFSEDKFAFCLADISGKGVSAALLMANFQAIVQSLIHQYRDLSTFIIALNQAVLRITKSERYLTFFIAEVDLKTRTLRYVNAGHYPPILFTDGKVERLEKGCTIIGHFEQISDVEEGTISLDHETLILTFTDGLVDLVNDADEHYGEDYLIAFIEEKSQLDAEMFNQELRQELERFKGGQDYPDDIAILTCKIY